MKRIEEGELSDELSDKVLSYVIAFLFPSTVEDRPITTTK